GRFVNPEILAAYRARLGLDQPIVVQYFRWLGAAVTGDLGYSYTSAQPVLTMILERLPATIELMLSAYLLAAVIALPLGVYSAIHKYSVLDYFGTGLSFLGIAMPVFWFGLILQLVFAVQLGWLPSSGRETVGDTGFVDQLKHLILPAIVLSLLYIAGWSRYMRTSFLGVINSDYVRTARAKGLRERRVMLVHGLKNAAIPVVSIMALDIAGLFSGAVITETIFSWPGIGRLFIQSMYSRDYPLLMGIIMMGSIMVVLFNLVADILYGWLDPRISYD
ncbi:MAG: ABC transporter permease, partial [Caldilineaceae bacterium]|nr:ABC transporter permease [Caldilineaceae bacterium]